jgi:Fic family protein
MQWPTVTFETRQWRRNPDELALMSKTKRRRVRSTYECAVPARIADLPVELPCDLVARLSDTTSRATRFDERFSSKAYDLPALLLRSESASSSQIERLTSSLRNVVLAELTDDTSENARLIAAHTRSMRRALSDDGPITTDAIVDMHRILMDDAPFTGSFREQQVWIGGTSFSPHEATFVPPHADRVAAAMEDWTTFANRTDVEPIAKAALAHAQFETVHPFTDGNGRCGRTLLHRMMRQDEVFSSGTLPISSGLLHDVDGYMVALDAYQQGDPVPIICAVADAFDSAIVVAADAVREIDGCLEEWDERMTERRGSSIRRLPALLVEQPVVDVKYVADKLGITTRAALTLVDRACEYGILERFGSKRRGAFYQSPELLEIMEDISNAAVLRRTKPGR